VKIFINETAKKSIRTRFLQLSFFIANFRLLYVCFFFFLFSAVEVVAVIIIILNRSSKIMETMSDKE
jgi:hypothetical protein